MDVLVGRAVFRVAGMVLVALAAALHVLIAGVEMLAGATWGLPLALAGSVLTVAAGASCS